MTVCSTFIYAWALFLAAFGMGERVYLQHLTKLSQAVAQGDSEADVLAKLGQPHSKLEANRGLMSLVFGRRPAQWAYGPLIDLGEFITPELPFPNPAPISLRFFSADEEDLVISWSKDKRVMSVNRPSLQYPAELVEGVAFAAFWLQRLTSFAPNGN